MDWNRYGFVVGSGFRIKVLTELEYAKTPTQLSKKLNSSTSHVSRALKELSDHFIVECITPANKVGRLYQLTENGKEIHEYYQQSMK